MKLIWHGHACFECQTKQGTVIFDPFKDGSVPGIRDLALTAHEVYTSHQHGDHNAKEVVTLLNEKHDLIVERVETYHDDKQGTLRGPNTIHILHAEDMKIVHLGDLGCDLTDEQLLKIKQCDVLMIPVGGHYTIDASMAKHLVDKIEPRVTVPMHYRSDTFGFGVIGTVEEYTSLCKDVVVYPDRELKINKETTKQTAVLTYK